MARRQSFTRSIFQKKTLPGRLKSKIFAERRQPPMRQKRRRSHPWKSLRKVPGVGTPYDGRTVQQPRTGGQSLLRLSFSSQGRVRIFCRSFPANWDPAVSTLRISIGSGPRPIEATGKSKENPIENISSKCPLRTEFAVTPFWWIQKLAPPFRGATIRLSPHFPSDLLLTKSSNSRLSSVKRFVRLRKSKRPPNHWESADGSCPATSQSDAGTSNSRHRGGARASARMIP